MNNKRQLERKEPNQAYEVFSIHSDQPLGQLANITTEGLMLITAEPMAADSLHQLRMPLAEPINGNPDINFGAEALWCRQASSNNYWVGLHIIDISPESIQIIEIISQEWETTRN